METQTLFGTTEASAEQVMDRPRFQLTSSDIEMIEYLYQLRIGTINHLSALTGRSYKKVHGRLFKLIENRYLARIKLPLQKHLYVLGRAGVPVLVERGIAPKEALEWRLRHHELKELFLKHQLMIVELHTMMRIAAVQNGIRVATWKEGKGLWDRVTVTDPSGKTILPIRPDAFFTLESAPENGPRTFNFFLEADRSTMTHERFQKKIRAYWAYLEQGLHTRRYGIRSFRVVTTTITHARALNLCEAAKEVLPPEARKYFLFASMQDLSLERPAAILSDVFLSPRGYKMDERHALL
jgi:hypothetical protein